jgi:hypothetical protein
MEKFDKAAHVGALVIVGQIHIHIDSRNRMLRTISPITHGNGIAKIFYPDFIDGNIAEIRLTLDVLHNIISKGNRV